MNESQTNNGSSSTGGEERDAARQEAAVEFGKAIAMGLIPFVGQAIDAYDTIESAIALYRAREGEARETAQFDFLLALVGWIPGPGDGVKKSLRIVNRDPQRFAPVLFDLLRFVLQECGMQTSPEALLDAVFDSERLQSQLSEIESGVIDSSGFQALPEVMQDVVRGTLKTARLNMPALVGVVQKRLTAWKRLQRNSSASEPAGGRSERPPPGSRDDQLSSQGESRGAPGHANTGTHASLATQALQDVTNEMAGISGEHIADYICAYTFRWGTDWRDHDDGSTGQWRDGTPSATKAGKLSKGGSPRQHHALYKLSDGANGTGIDAVWRADGHNGGKPFAIVEAKATRDEDAPKFLRKPDNTRKPSITSTLGANAITDPSELLEPLEDAGSGTPGKTGGGKTGGKSAGRKAVPTGSGPKSGRDGAEGQTSSHASRKTVLVQMSREWIEANMSKSVGDSMKRHVLVSYSRHLFFSPAYHPSGSPLAHMQAKADGLRPEHHATHDAFHYDETEVRAAVNRRKTSLRKKYGNLPTLQEEK